MFFSSSGRRVKMKVKLTTLRHLCRVSFLTRLYVERNVSTVATATRRPSRAAGVPTAARAALVSAVQVVLFSVTRWRHRQFFSILVFVLFWCFRWQCRGRWCRSHDAECRKMAACAGRIYETFVSQDAALDYVEMVREVIASKIYTRV